MTEETGRRDEACAQYVRDTEGREAGAVVAAVLRCAAQKQQTGPEGDAPRRDVTLPVAAAQAGAALSQMRKAQPELPTLPAAGVAKVLRCGCA